ncbi:shikimate dehydrogenase [Actinophytocola xanthii]|uniref:Shikimate dehydrogenase (NADP(+)) n=1 Tax=Actinophytocola xanthii TaxID=1912961 RepID=A0A1Q8CW33_9PSEU|nr:shikimate dehydrogenase [Actinophytocola xanthii]OLF18567.1 shikimate dehydrogenase [Actinophytocola xanthii]
MAVARTGPGYLVGLIGAGIGASLSPQLHEREADALGVRYLYRLLDLEVLGVPPRRVGDVLDAARLAGYDGLNLTHPVKQLVLDHLDELTPEAAAIGAVNTVVFTGGRSVGHNTDLTGFSRGLRTGLPDVALDRVVLLGAGGAGAAVGHALLSLGAKTLEVFDLEPARADGLAASLRERFGPDRVSPGRLGGGSLTAALEGADGLVHATPTGMAGRPGVPLPEELLRAEHWVADIVYRPLETDLLRTARARGCRVLDGGRMAVFQAAETFRIITGREPDPDRMLRHFADLAPNGDAEVRDRANR